MITAFGKALRKLRIDRGEVLKDMADKLNVSPSFISAVENGRKNAPTGWINEIASAYDLGETERKDLHEAAKESVQAVKISLFGADYPQRSAALVFARDFDSLTEETARRIIDLLQKDAGGKGGQ
ncbi:helix-turn-helix domain-containing protein [Intestinimonas butyriciproducens]|uniref:helix-turn-helix domain-containing protein n=1 Tax=Intestinimonas butyriciproducens TaxID=1297617 RepID=UPI003AEF8126